MARKRACTDEHLFATVAAELVDECTVTLQRLAERAGVSIGSLYHRYGSREGLLAHAWLAAVDAFQQDFLAALAGTDLAAGERAALATPRFCRREPAVAALLACCRRAEFIGPGTPPDLRAAAARGNDEVATALGAFARATGRWLLACRLALVEFPLAAVRPYLPLGPVPEALDAIVLRACRAVLGMRSVGGSISWPGGDLES